mmetsp:Transcript_9062/g.12020  ORF Transcript_9062/g.12020 Transcript_9062/m.12020 type:complete len:323 (-) Transcript_9062:322-1290(-)|eukprot:CAMPEP_0117752492 /NCGR_PEP_ID=MMETSP0947-20121206/11639_1 /TAXON_ID=44440 /ORGANISM="Chattonella subsalsa, Strain CCMP2191" /LENGTH=322 /DNA_ID=CAMNT_0005571147 /DNA_START=728 /DNA_END=1696 /DNA_ORIENTATION=+
MEVADHKGIEINLHTGEVSSTSEEKELKPCSLFCKEFQACRFKMQMSLAELSSFGDSPVLCMKKFALYRSFVATYFVALFWWSWGDMIEGDQAGYFWIYLTHWTLVMEMIYLILAAVVSLKMPEIQKAARAQLGQEGRSPSTLVSPPHLVLVTWVFQHICLVSSLIVFLLYWMLVYTPDRTIYATTVQVHGVNFFFMAVDVLLSGASYRPLHVHAPFLYAFTYLIWSIIFSAAKMNNELGDGYIYSSLDWRGAFGTACTIGLIVVFFVVPLLHTLLWWYVSIKIFRMGRTDEWMESCLKEAANNTSTQNLQEDGKDAPTTTL